MTGKKLGGSCLDSAQKCKHGRRGKENHCPVDYEINPGSESHGSLGLVVTDIYIRW